MNRRALLARIPAAAALAVLPDRARASTLPQEARSTVETAPYAFVGDDGPELISMPSNPIVRFAPGWRTIHYEIVAHSETRLWVSARMIDMPGHPLQEFSNSLLYAAGVDLAIGSRFLVEGYVNGYYDDQLTYRTEPGKDRFTHIRADE